MCPPSPGALYSRKVTLDGEEVSLQIQDTPCVALQVTNGHKGAARTFAAETIWCEQKIWMETVKYNPQK